MKWKRSYDLTELNEGKDYLFWIDLENGYWVTGFIDNGGIYYSSGDLIEVISQITHYTEVTKPKN